MKRPVPAMRFLAVVGGLLLAVPGVKAADAPGTPAPGGLPAVITGALARDTPAPAASPEPAEAPAVHRPAGPTVRPAPTPVIPNTAAMDTALDRQSLVRQAIHDQLAAQTQLAQRAVAAGDAEGAERAFGKLLSLPAPAAEKRAALGQMAAFYKDRHQVAKAAAVYEKILGLFPDDPENPALYFELGRSYRDAGLYDLAISRFYSVLNSTISQSDSQEQTRNRRNLSLLAQFEIAEASFAKGDYAAAAKFYSRLQLLELPAADRPTLAFKYAQSLFRGDDYAGAAAALRGFIDNFPASPSAPEARNLLARSFQKLKRPQEATDAVLALLRQEKKAGDTANLARWQRETGRQVAAQFYDEGDFRSALTIYQTLATLDAKPDWQWPIVYEIGLCFERLRLPDRAREAYDYLQRPPAADGKSPVVETKLPPALTAIRDMAKWRQDHLAWAQDNTAQLQALLGSLDKHADVPANAANDDAPSTERSASKPPAATPPPLPKSAAH